MDPLSITRSDGVPSTAPNQLVVSVVSLRGDCELRAAWKLDDEFIHIHNMHDVINIIETDAAVILGNVVWTHDKFRTLILFEFVLLLLL